ncbi:hypothetical protein AB1Y20_003025 [Prymnesium parvum]|uniref:Uncharacterized protein n=1 Tax=Prymnesium parvum TaxID=97485 RepID=A0AB34JCX0_PRYPA
MMPDREYGTSLRYEDVPKRKSIRSFEAMGPCPSFEKGWANTEATRLTNKSCGMTAPDLTASIARPPANHGSHKLPKQPHHTLLDDKLANNLLTPCDDNAKLDSILKQG